MSTTIIISVVVFLVVTLLLVALLLVAKNKLSPSGTVKITVNDEKEFDVHAGKTVLNTLQENGIYLSSACGGGGSCGQCRCQVVEGGGGILPTEVDFFSRREMKDHWRLGCQTKVKEDLKIVVPEEVFGVKEWECEVVSNDNVATYIKEFVVKLPEGETLNFKPGSYIQIYIPKFCVQFKDLDVDPQYHDDWKKYHLFEMVCTNEEETVRAYSMANHPAEGNIVMLNVRIATAPLQKGSTYPIPGIPPGIGSSYIFGLKPGDKVRVSGPYGDFHILDTKREMVYIGGGAGMAPLRSHLMHLFETLKTKDRKISYWYGARSKREVFYEEDFRKFEKEFPNFSFHLALSNPLPEDNWTGLTGYIHDVLEKEYLGSHEAPEDIEYYMCGPGPMAKSVQGMLYNLGVPDEMLHFDDFGG